MGKKKGKKGKSAEATSQQPSQQKHAGPSGHQGQRPPQRAQDEHSLQPHAETSGQQGQRPPQRAQDQHSLQRHAGTSGQQGQLPPQRPQEQPSLQQYVGPSSQQGRQPQKSQEIAHDVSRGTAPGGMQKSWASMFSPPGQPTQPPIQPAEGFPQQPSKPKPPLQQEQWEARGKGQPSGGQPSHVVTSPSQPSLSSVQGPQGPRYAAPSGHPQSGGSLPKQSSEPVIQPIKQQREFSQPVSQFSKQPQGDHFKSSRDDDPSSKWEQPRQQQPRQQQPRQQQQQQPWQQQQPRQQQPWQQQPKQQQPWQQQQQQPRQQQQQQPWQQQKQQPRQQQQQQPRQQQQQQPWKTEQRQQGFSAQTSRGGKSTSSLNPPSSAMSKFTISDTVPKGLKYKPGTQGTSFKIKTNHLTLNADKLTTVYHYDVEIKPERTSKKVLQDVMELFRKRHYPDKNPAFDGRKNLYTVHKLFLPNDSKTDTISYGQNRVKDYTVDVKFVKEVDLRILQHFENQPIEAPREALQAIDIILHSALVTQDFRNVGRSYFSIQSLNKSMTLADGMNMCLGLFQSAVRGWKLFVNVDVCHKAVTKDIEIPQLLTELQMYKFYLTEDAFLRGEDRTKVENLLKQLNIMYSIPNVNVPPKIYRVNKLDRSAREATFTLDSGETVTVEEYYLKHHNYRIRYPKLPTILVSQVQLKKKILLPLELCSVVGGQFPNKKMTDKQTSAMIKHAATTTAVREQKILDKVQECRYDQSPIINEFKLEIGPNFITIDARKLDPPILQYDKDKSFPNIGKWRGTQFIQGAVIKKWTVISFTRMTKANDLNELATKILSNASGCGIKILSEATKPFKIEAGTSFAGPPANVVEDTFTKCASQHYDVIFVIVPNSGQQYGYVKRAAEINAGCLTQCIKANTLKYMNVSTVNNILLKVNSKLNGINYSLAKEINIIPESCMLMGADVTHPSPDAQHIPSVAAVTASHEQNAFQYNICWRLQPPTVEIIQDLKAIVVEQLKYYEDKNAQLPKKIIFFRDGVSEGQFNIVMTKEITAIRAACEGYKKGIKYKPKITFLVVQKRHHTRMFPIYQYDMEGTNQNVKPGSVVDTHITNPNMQDFYLVSHSSPQGVARPTKYCTLCDDNEFTNDAIQKLTYFLCHMYARCTKSVSYPAPTYYAHLAAARAKVYIENSNLNLLDLTNEQKKYEILSKIRKDHPMFFV